jgi:hypothetical protein
MHPRQCFAGDWHGQGQAGLAQTLARTPVSLADLAEWHGYANGNAALFITPIDDEQVGLFMQQDRSTQLAAVFTDPAMAVMVMDWMDDSLQKTAEANSQLLERLQSEQPLAFAQPPQAPLEDSDELFSED